MTEGRTPGLDGAWLTPRRFAGLLALFIFASFPEVIVGLKSFVHRDFGLFGYPLAHYHRDCFWRGELPLWNPYNNAGLPFLAQWNTMVLYPGSLIHLLLPLPWSLNVFCLAHLWLAGMGMYWLAERWTGNRLAAAVAGMAFAFNGLTLNALMWPNNIVALSWMPWVIGAAELGLRKGRRSLAVAALVAALQMLSGAPEIILFTWILVATMFAGQWLKKSRPRGELFARFAGLALLVVALSAAQLLPFLDLLRHSHRDASFATGAWAMPLWGWANFFVPQFRVIESGSGVLYQPEQFWTSSHYLGVAACVLALWAAARWRQPRVCWLTLFLLLGLVLSIGDEGGLYRWIREAVPQANFMRFPIKFVVIVVYALPMLAALALADWSRQAKEPSRAGAVPAGWPVLLAVLVMAGVVAWARLAPIHQDDAGRTIWSALRTVCFLLATMWLLSRLASGRSFVGVRVAQAGVLALLWLDVMTHVPNQNPTVPPAVLSSAIHDMPALPKPGVGRAALSLAAMDEMYRKNVRDPAENFLLRRQGLHQNVNLIDPLPKVDGFYSLYLPRERKVHFRLYRSDHELRGGLADFLGVSQVTSPTNLMSWSYRATAMPQATGGQKPMFVDEGTALTNLISADFDPRRTVLLPVEAAQMVVATNAASVRLSDIDWSAHRVRLEAEADHPAWLVFAQAHYHSWQAFVDGAKSRVWLANAAFQAVEIPPGRHRVELVYRDFPFRFGCCLSLAGMALTAWLWRRRGGND